MDQYIEVRRRQDTDDAPPLAVIYPPDRIEGTDDPAVLGDIRAALSERRGGVLPTAGGWFGWVSASPRKHHPHSLRWAIAVHIALSRRGYRCRAVGYTAGSQTRPW